MVYGIMNNEGRVIFTGAVKATVTRLAATRSLRGTVVVNLFGTWVPVN